MLTGVPPYKASSPQAVYARMLMEKARSIRSIRPAVPEHIEAAVMRALEQLPADRFSSAKEFARHCLDGSSPILLHQRRRATMQR